MAEKSRSEQNQTLLDTLFLDGGNAYYLEQMQAQYAANPNSVDPSWLARKRAAQPHRLMSIKPQKIASARLC